MRTLVYTAQLDDRAGGKVASRIGISAEARHFGPGRDLHAEIAAEQATAPLACVLVDEAQFLTAQHVRQLARVVDELNVPVLCYGLRTDFLGRLFEGSAQLLAWADDGRVESSGAQVEIGGNDRYVPLCRRHFVAALESGEA